MSSKLNMQDIIDLLLANNDISKEEAEKFIVEFFDIIEKGLSTDELVKVKDFGTFKLTQIQERESIDVNTQEKIVIPSHRRVSFIPASTLKELVNKPFAHFETTPLNDGILLDGVYQDDSLDKEDDDEKDNEDEQDKEENAERRDSIAPDIDETKSKELEEEIEIPAIPIIDNDSITESAPKKSLMESDKKEPSLEEKKPNINSPKKSKTRKPKTRGKLRRYILRWDVAVALFMILGVGFAYNYYFAKHNPCKHGVEDSDIPKPIKTGTPSSIENISNKSAAVVDSVKTNKSMKPIKTVEMSPGKTLRLIALDKFGDREFWVYIYMKNEDKIKNPDVVPVGLKLELPHVEEFDMDANNHNHVSKAKKLGDEMMKKFW